MCLDKETIAQIIDRIKHLLQEQSIVQIDLAIGHHTDHSFIIYQLKKDEYFIIDSYIEKRKGEIRSINITDVKAFLLSPIEENDKLFNINDSIKCPICESHRFSITLK